MASAALEDFARRPTSYKATVFGGILLALAGVYYQFGYKSLSNDLDEARGNSVQMATKKARYERDEVAFRELQTKMVALKRIIDENQKALPTGAELPAFFDMLNRKVNEAGVEIRKWEYKSDIPVAEFVKVPVELELTGTFFQLKRFFASLVQRGISGRPGEEDERERIITIENLQLTNPQIKNREVLMTAKFTASTFRQEDRAEGAPGSKPASGNRPAPGTPGAMKSQVESSIRQQDDRTRNGSGLDALTPQGGDKGAAAAKASAGADRLKGGI